MSSLPLATVQTCHLHGGTELSLCSLSSSCYVCFGPALTVNWKFPPVEQQCVVFFFFFYSLSTLTCILPSDSLLRSNWSCCSVWVQTVEVVHVCTKAAFSCSEDSTNSSSLFFQSNFPFLLPFFPLSQHLICDLISLCQTLLPAFAYIRLFRLHQGSVYDSCVIITFTFLAKISSKLLKYVVTCEDEDVK